MKEGVLIPREECEKIWKGLTKEQQKAIMLDRLPADQKRRARLSKLDPVKWWARNRWLHKSDILRKRNVIEIMKKKEGN